MDSVKVIRKLTEPGFSYRELVFSILEKYPEAVVKTLFPPVEERGEGSVVLFTARGELRLHAAEYEGLVSYMKTQQDVGKFSRIDSIRYLRQFLGAASPYGLVECRAIVDTICAEKGW